ncbi:MAG: protein kinase domain-containing protein [Polyangiaceae bacterium]
MASVRRDSFARAWLVALISLFALVGCGREPTLVLTSWELEAPDSAHAHVTLPVHLDRELPARRSRYALRTSVTLPPDLRGRALTLAIPILNAPCALLVDGRRMAPLDIGTDRAYRGNGHPRWTIPEDATSNPTLDLELDIDHTWTQSAWLDAPPRLSATPEGDATYLAVTGVTDLCAALGLTAILLGVPLYLGMFLLDRRRVAYAWWSVQMLTGLLYPAFVLGLTPRVFGIYDTPIMSVGLCVSVWAGVHFTHLHFGLPRPHVLWALGSIVCLAVAIPGGGPFWSTRVVTPITVVCVVAAIAYQLYLPLRRWRKSEGRVQSMVLFFGWGAVGLLGAADFIAWMGLGEVYGGARSACLGMAFIAIFQSLVQAGDHITSLRRADRLNVELAGQVDALQSKNREVELLNVELRRQIGARSEHLALALARLTAAGSAPVRSLNVGDVVDERYRVVAAIGRGAMGVVYEVERVSDARRLALKLLANADAVHMARFAREAQIVSRLDHPSIVSIVDVAVAGSGFLYLVMEHVEGRSLDEHRARYGDLGWALAVLQQVAEGLAAIHEHGVVHRDLKPGNLLVASGDAASVPCVKIADFGISRLEARIDDGGTGGTRVVPLVHPSRPPPLAGNAVPREAKDPRSDSDERNLTETGMLLGTPKYMAPELVGMAQDAHPPSDVFSFAVIAYELITGALPFREPAAILAMNSEAIPPPAPLVSQVPGELASLLEQCLVREPVERPTAKTLAEALARARGTFASA